MTYLCKIRYFIGIKIDRKDNQISLSQSAYIKNVFKKIQYGRL